MSREQVLEQLTAATHRRLGWQLRPCQLDAAGGLLDDSVIELDTGQGKTLVTVIAAVLMVRAGRRVRIATSNDYLARRDAEWMTEIYRDLGVSVGCVTTDSSTANKHAAYACDVVYGTVREFGFDQLRSELAIRVETRTNRADWLRFDALIVDEADSVLIDDAATPLIMTAPASTESKPLRTERSKPRSGTASPLAPGLAGERDGVRGFSDRLSDMDAGFRWAAEAARQFEIGRDVVFTADGAEVALTQSGRWKLLQSQLPAALNRWTTTDLQYRLEQAVWVGYALQPGQAYVVSDQAIKLVDEFTGRIASGRQLGQGLHQAVEAKEGLPITALSTPVARMTVQDFASQFRHLSGLTGTAWEARREFRRVYGLAVHRIAPHQTSLRQLLVPRLAAAAAEKWQLVAAEVAAVIQQGRSVLLGTRTVAESEAISRILTAKQIEHVVLNARHPDREAAIVAAAGNAGRVTVATNMAGRGTDIVLDDRVRNAGGLHVIVSELHASARIDRQLIGRAGRQGDPGSARIFASAEDDILRLAHGVDAAAAIASRAARDGVGEWLWRMLIRSQRLVEQQRSRDRAAVAQSEKLLADAASMIGLDPHLDPLPVS